MKRLLWSAGSPTWLIVSSCLHILHISVMCSSSDATRTEMEKKYKIVCYYTNWSQYRPAQGKFTPENIDARLCTHIMYAFAKLENGLIAPYEWNDEQMYRKVMEHKKTNPSLEVLLAIGGWNHGSESFSDMVAIAESRSRFIEHAVKYLRKYEFDGLDLDWEYPASRGGRPEDKDNFVLLLKELRQSFDATGGGNRLILTVAAPAGLQYIKPGYKIPQINKYVDFINLMAYDFNGAWNHYASLNSPLHDDHTNLNVEWSVNYWLSAGTPSERLVLGMPTYGRTFTLTDPHHTALNSSAAGPGNAGTYTQTRGFLSYYEICDKVSDGSYTRVWLDDYKVPYAFGDNQWISYDDERSIKYKVDYIKEQSLGGAMMWALDLDDFTGQCTSPSSRYPLLRLVNRHLSTGDAEQSLDETQADPLSPAPVGSDVTPDRALHV